MVKLDGLLTNIEGQARTIAFQVAISKVLFEVRQNEKRSFRPAITPEGKTAVLSGLNKKVIRHRDNYVGFLNALSLKLANPGMANLTETDPTINIKFGKPYLSASVSPHWNPLSEKTIAIKNAGGGEKTIWKHTGQLSRAFAGAVASQKTKWAMQDFVDYSKAEATLSKLDSEVKRKGAGFVSKSNKEVIQFEVDFTIPKWKGANADVMDSLVVNPYLGIKAGSTAFRLIANASKDTSEELAQKAAQIAAKIKQRKASMGTANGRVSLVALKELHQLQQELKQLYISDNRAKLRNKDGSSKGAIGLRRLLQPEHHRPFIQKLSAAAGKLALQDLKSST